MKYKKMQLKALFTLPFLLYNFTACFPNGENVINSDMDSKLIADLNISSNDNVTYDFKIPQMPDTTYPYVFIKRKIIDSDTLIHTVLGSELHCTEHTINPSDTIPNEDLMNIYDFPDNSVFFCDAGIFKYFGAKDESRGYSTYESRYDTRLTAENMRKDFSKSELEKFSSEECVRKMERIINELSLMAEDSPEIYVLDEETISTIGYSDEWNNVDNAYMIVYSTEYNGLKLPDFDIYFPNNPTNSYGRPTDLPGSRITGIFSKNGLEFFSCDYVPEIIEERGEAQICPPETAIAAVKGRYESISLNNGYKYKISGCELMYLPYPQDDGYLLTPTWFFVSETQIPGMASSYYDDIFVNAVTGIIYE